MLVNKEISSGHARAILTIEEKDKQYEIARKVFDENLSVRDTEKLVKELEKKFGKITFEEYPRGEENFNKLRGLVNDIITENINK